MRCTLAACAQSLIRDADSNTVSLVSLIEEFNVPGLPGVLASLNTLFILDRDEGDDDRNEMVLRISNENQPPYQEFPVTVDFEGKNRTRAVVRMGGLPINSPGKLRIGIAFQDAEDLLGWWDISVMVTGPPIVVNQTV